MGRELGKEGEGGWRGKGRRGGRGNGEEQRREGKWRGWE